MLGLPYCAPSATIARSGSLHNAPSNMISRMCVGGMGYVNAPTLSLLSLCVSPYLNICVDIDECAIETDNNCSGNATCENEPGTYNCTCILGFTGDGVTCTGK